MVEWSPIGNFQDTDVGYALCRPVIASASYLLLGSRFWGFSLDSRKLSLRSLFIRFSKCPFTVISLIVISPIPGQALYFCVPFRDQLLDYYANNKIIGDEDNLLACLADLFTQV